MSTQNTAAVAGTRRRRDSDSDQGRSVKEQPSNSEHTGANPPTLEAEQLAAAEASAQVNASRLLVATLALERLEEAIKDRDNLLVVFQREKKSWQGMIQRLETRVEKADEEKRALKKQIEELDRFCKEIQDELEIVTINTEQIVQERVEEAMEHERMKGASATGRFEAQIAALASRIPSPTPIPQLSSSSRRVVADAIRTGAPVSSETAPADSASSASEPAPASAVSWWDVLRRKS
ncbi:hypothetical protein C8F01DRAFT_1379400 [Mycena amicta]|nr:hypothetical protein C8F01DRAFT_1379400 [Mycena amicta]